MRARLGIGAAALAAVGLSAWAALTNPFTVSADVVTALALLLGVVTLVVGRVVSPRRASVPAAPVGAAHPARWPWVALLVAVVAWEVVSYALGPRVDHPTLSSLYDAAATVRPVKGLFFLAWLGLGAALVWP